MHGRLFLNRFSRPGGSGLLTTSRFDDFELMDRPAGRDLTLERLLQRASAITERLFYIDVAGSSLRAAIKRKPEDSYEDRYTL